MKNLSVISMCIGNILPAYSYILCHWPSKRVITALGHGDGVHCIAITMFSLVSATSTSDISFQR